MPRGFLGTPLHVSILVSDSIMADRLYHSAMVTVGGFEIMVDLLLLNMLDFDVIFGMDWLSRYHAILYCQGMTLMLTVLGLPRLE